MRARDEPRHVGENHGAAVFGLHNPQVRVQGREGIGGDLRMRARQRCQQRRLAGVGQADQAGIGDQLQLQAHAPLLTRLAELCRARRLPRRRGETRVAAAAPPAAHRHHTHAGREQVSDDLVAVAHERAWRHMQQHVGAVATPAIASLTGATMLGTKPAPVAVRGQGRVARIGDHGHVTAAPAVTTVRAAFGHELLAPEAHRPTSAVPGDDVEIDLVEEVSAGRRYPAASTRTRTGIAEILR